MTRRHSKRRVDSIKIVMPAHLCQLYCLKRAGENGRSTIYSPKANEPVISSAKSQ